MKMKKYFLLVFVSLYLSTSLAVYLYSAAPKTQKKNALAGIVTTTKGKVQVSKNGKDFKQAKIGDFLYEGDTVKTLKKSQSAVTYTNGVIIKSNQNTEYLISISEQLEKIGSRIKLASGQLWTKVRPKTKFEIKTPVAVVAVRGTEFDLNYDGRNLDLAVYDGTVNLGNEKGSKDVNKGQKSSCSGGNPPGDPEPNDKKNDWQGDLATKGVLKLESKILKPIVSVPMEVLISVYDNSNKIDATYKDSITVKSELTTMLFSIDGSKWDKEITADAAAGVLKIFSKCSEVGSGSIAASAENYAPGTLDLSFETPKNKNLRMKIKTETGEEDVILKFEKKP